MSVRTGVTWLIVVFVFPFLFAYMLWLDACRWYRYGRFKGRL